MNKEKSQKRDVKKKAQTTAKEKRKAKRARKEEPSVGLKIPQ